jgi:hypothetical protein
MILNPIEVYASRVLAELALNPITIFASEILAYRDSNPITMAAAKMLIVDTSEEIAPPSLIITDGPRRCRHAMCFRLSEAVSTNKF